MNIQNLNHVIDKELKVYINNELKCFHRYSIKNTVYIHKTYTECKYVIFGITRGIYSFILHTETSKLYMNDETELQQYTNGLLESYLKYYTNSGIK